MTRQRHKGDRYRPIVTIVKLKNGTIPTVIQVSGRTYILRHEDTKPARKHHGGGGLREHSSKNQQRGFSAR